MDKTIANLKKLKSFHNGSYGADIDKAIKALELEPCEDCVSRDAVEDAIYDATRSLDLNYEQIMNYIDKIPSVQPKPKTGHWIMPVQDDGTSDPIYYQVRCSECNFDLDPQTWHMELHQHGADKSCPRCGCRMESE